MSHFALNYLSYGENLHEQFSIVAPFLQTYPTVLSFKKILSLVETDFDRISKFINMNESDISGKLTQIFQEAPYFSISKHHKTCKCFLQNSNKQITPFQSLYIRRLYYVTDVTPRNDVVYIFIYHLFTLSINIDK